MQMVAGIDIWWAMLKSPAVPTSPDKSEFHLRYAEAAASYKDAVPNSAKKFGVLHSCEDYGLGLQVGFPNMSAEVNNALAEQSRGEVEMPSGFSSNRPSGHGSHKAPTEPGEGLTLSLMNPLITADFPEDLWSKWLSRT